MMNDATAVQSSWTRSLRAGGRPDPEMLREHLRAVHEAHPGFTEACAGRCRDSRGRNSYEWLAEAVSAGGGRVLDVACGSGVLLQECRRRFGPDLDLVGLDMSGSELGLARARLGEDGGGGARLIEGMAQDMRAVETGSVGTVLCHWALTLMDPVEPVLAEIRRVLRPGGTFAAVVDGDPAAAPGYAEIDALIYGRVRRELPRYGTVELGDPRVRGTRTLVELARGAFPGAEVDVEAGLMTARGTAAALADEVAGFFYAAFVLGPGSRRAMLAELAELLGRRGGGPQAFTMPINRLLVRDRHEPPTT